MNYNQTGAKPIISMKWVIALTLLLTLVLGGVIASKAQTVPNGKVYNLDAADRVKTSNTAIYNGKTFIVYANKKGRLYFENGKVSKTGKLTRKYLTK